jgi:hypothetical protein
LFIMYCTVMRELVTTLSPPRARARVNPNSAKIFFNGLPAVDLPMHLVFCNAFIYGFYLTTRGSDPDHVIFHHEKGCIW